jgi:hypothetical protein
MKIRVTGGTHIGIASCYGEKDFEVDMEIQLSEVIRKNQGIPPEAKLESYIHNGKRIWCFIDPKDGKSVLFEFYYTLEGTEGVE